MCFPSSLRDPGLRTPELGLFYISMKGLSWGDKLLLAELGPEHMFLIDCILCYRPLECCVSLRPKSPSGTRHGMRNPGCGSAGRHPSLPYLGKSGLAQQPPLLSQILSAAWRSWLWEGNTEDVAGRTVPWGNLSAIRQWSEGSAVV